MNEFIKKYRKLFLLVIFIIPLILNLGMSISNFGVGSNDGWLGFWGGYIGSILSGIIAYYIARYQIKKEFSYRDSKEKENRLYSLLPYFNIDECSVCYLNDNKIDNFYFELSIATSELSLPIIRLTAFCYFNISIEKNNSYEQIDKINKPFKIDVGHVFPTTNGNKPCKRKFKDYEKEFIYNYVEKHVDKYKNYEDSKLYLIIDRIDISCRNTQEKQIFFTYGDGVQGAHGYKTEGGGYCLYLKDGVSDAKILNERAEEHNK